MQFVKNRDKADGYRQQSQGKLRFQGRQPPRNDYNFAEEDMDIAQLRARRILFPLHACCVIGLLIFLFTQAI